MFHNNSLRRRVNQVVSRSPRWRISAPCNSDQIRRASGLSTSTTTTTTTTTACRNPSIYPSSPRHQLFDHFSNGRSTSNRSLHLPSRFLSCSPSSPVPSFWWDRSNHQRSARFFSSSFFLLQQQQQQLGSKKIKFNGADRTNGRGGAAGEENPERLLRKLRHELQQLAMQKRWQEIIVHVDQTLSSNNNNKPTNLLRFRCESQFHLRQYLEAIQDANSYFVLLHQNKGLEASNTATDPEDDNEDEAQFVLWMRGLSNYHLGEFGDAVHDFEPLVQKKLTENDLAIEINPIDLLKCYSVALQMIGRYHDAIHGYTLALEHCPDNVGILNNRAVCYLSLHRLEDARRDLDRSLELEPEQPAQLHLRSQVNLLLKNYEQAHEDAVQAIETQSVLAETTIGIIMSASDQAAAAAAGDEEEEEDAEPTTSAAAVPPVFRIQEAFTLGFIPGKRQEALQKLQRLSQDSSTKLSANDRTRAKEAYEDLLALGSATTTTTTRD